MQRFILVSYYLSVVLISLLFVVIFQPEKQMQPREQIQEQIRPVLQDNYVNQLLSDASARCCTGAVSRQASAHMEDVLEQNAIYKITKKAILL